MKKNLSADGMLCVIKHTTTHRYALYHKVVFTTKGDRYFIVSITEFRTFIEKTQSTKLFYSNLLYSIGIN
jgi:hypothetical protein